MKKNILSLVLVIPLFSLFLLSCGGGGGSSSGGGGGTGAVPPVISNLSYSPQSATLNEGGGSVVVSVTFSFSSGNQLRSVSGFEQRSDGSINVFSESPVTGSNRGTGTISWSIVRITTRQSQTPFGIYVTDITGNKSNSLWGNVPVN